MNANQLYVDEFYAWHPTPRKGHFTEGGRKVRLQNVEIRKTRTDSNAKTFAHVVVVDTNREMVVRAREIMDFWNNYEREINLINSEREAKENERKRRLVREKTIGTIIALRLQEKTGMPAVGRLTYSPYAGTVTLPEQLLRDWLEITESDIERAVDGSMNDQRKEAE